MPDMQKLQNNKNKILSVIQAQGPSLPARVARETGISPLFVSAFLAELVSERRLKITNMKVGSSPIYYLSGQEDKLGQFNEYLNPKEKEAFHLIKENKVLEDESQEPAIRVALRQIKDFAIPLQVKRGDEIKLFWKFFLTNNENISEIISKKETSQPQIERNPEKEEEEKEEKEVADKEPTEKKVDEKTKESSNESEKEKRKLDIFDQEKPKKQERKEESNFLEDIRKHLNEKKLEISKEISEKKKEFVSKVKTNDSFGNQEYLLISKDKKKITENDLTIALQKAQVEKMPALIISPGDLDKKAQAYLEEWKNLIKYQKLGQTRDANL